MFKNFPKIGYVIDGKIVVATDIFRKIKTQQIAKNELVLTSFTIEAGQRPEDVADILYDDPKLYWTVLLVNDIIDPYNDWYYSPDQLSKLVDDKYGAGNSGNVHHFVTKDNNLVCVEYDAAKIANGEIFEVSHLQHEEFENDARQNIKVVDPKFIQDFISEFKRLVNE